MSKPILAACFATVLIMADTAHAGPANRHRPSHPVPVNLSGFGAPLRAIVNNPDDLQIFATGQSNFKEIDEVPQVGPVLNGVSCAGCHSQPSIGGAGLFINEIRVRDNVAPGPVHIFAVDNMLRGGPQSQNGATIFANGMHAEPLGCQITAPGCQLSVCQKEEAARTTFAWNLPECDPTSKSFTSGANCASGRAATPTFGLGLVEAVADQTLTDLAQSEPSAVRGTARMVTEDGQSRVARFGWKDDHATLRAFAADAYLNEMGITNPDAPIEVSSCALGQKQFGVLLQTDDGIEDPTDPDGRADIDRFADFMRALDAPPVLERNSSSRSGARAVPASRLRGLPHAEPYDRYQSRVICPHYHGRDPDQCDAQSGAGQPYLPSIFRFPAARHGFAGRRHHLGLRGTHHDAHGAAVGNPREVGLFARRAGARPPYRNHAA